MKTYCYKICYKKHGRDSLKTYLVTNTYDSAIWYVRWYETHSPPGLKVDTGSTKVEWRIVPVKLYIKYKMLWRDCPFEAIS